MKKMYDRYCLAEEVLCGALFASIVVLVFSSAVLRLFNNPLIWADDIAKLCFAWSAFLGADIAMRRCRLVGVDIVLLRLSPRLQKIVLLLGHLAIAATLAIFIFYGIKLTYASLNRHFQTIPISYSYVSVCLPVGSLCMLLTAAVRMGKLRRHLRDDEYSLAGEAQREEAENVERQVI
ncbi:MAG: TRAP transporter small permease [Planctomycetota bacterium]|jgi:TRAP-type C4-dicarboxylate transport system permease small subunit|nr:TRAP transporter small permease [Planctomycetota bacterium]